MFYESFIMHMIFIVTVMNWEISVNIFLPTPKSCFQEVLYKENLVNDYTN